MSSYGSGLKGLVCHDSTHLLPEITKCLQTPYQRRRWLRWGQNRETDENEELEGRRAPRLLNR